MFEQLSCVCDGESVCCQPLLGCCNFDIPLMFVVITVQQITTADHKYYTYQLYDSGKSVKLIYRVSQGCPEPVLKGLNRTTQIEFGIHRL